MDCEDFGGGEGYFEWIFVWICHCIIYESINEGLGKKEMCGI